MSPSGSFWPDEPVGAADSSGAAASPGAAELGEDSSGSAWTADPLSPSGSVFKLKAPTAETELDGPTWSTDTFSAVPASAVPASTVSASPVSASPAAPAEEPVMAEPEFAPSPAEYSAPSDYASYAAPRHSEPEPDDSVPFESVPFESVPFESVPFESVPSDSGRPVAAAPEAGFAASAGVLAGAAGAAGADEWAKSGRWQASAAEEPAASSGYPGAYSGTEAGSGAGADWSAASLGVSAGSGAGAAGGSGGYGGPGGSGGWGDGSGESADSVGQPRGRRLAPLIGIAAALIVLLGAGGIYYFSNASKASPDSGSGGTTVTRKVTAPKGPEQVSSVTPADGATDVNGGAAIKVEFSKPLSPSSPMPTLKPDIKGTWSVKGDTATFVPAAGFWQDTKVAVTIPAGASGVASSAGGQLGTPVTDTFTTGKFSEVRLEQDLTQLGYLPVTWAPSSGTPPPVTNLNAQYYAAYAPPQGTYTWQTGYPAYLESMWKPDAASQILRGAVAAFQADHGLLDDMIAENQDGLIVTGSIGHRLWTTMFKALASNDMNKHGYTYAIASQHYPETLTVWHNGTKIFHHLANTGIPVSPTAVGTDPVYIRYQSQIMKGTNPDGSQYADQVYWVAYFRDGEAVHYFPRYSYGSQQSLGCVELPYDAAKQIWPYLTYGTLVTVTKT